MLLCDLTSLKMHELSYLLIDITTHNWTFPKKKAHYLMQL